MDFMAVSTPDLLKSDSFCGIPQLVTACCFEPVRGTDSEDGEEEFG